jgi:hypothetical protein
MKHLFADSPKKNYDRGTDGSRIMNREYLMHGSEAKEKTVLVYKMSKLKSA